MIYRVLLLFIIAFLSSCKEDTQPFQLVLPSDLALELSYHPTIEGRVDLVATAKNTNFYSFYFQEGEFSETLKANDGIASHTYRNSGTYTIHIKAHATDAEYIEIWDTVEVTVTPSNLGNLPTKGYSTPLSYPEYNLVWQDEFDGSTLDLSNWNYEYGNSGWGNNELQYYRNENTSLSDGYLTITAKNESHGGSIYTSSRLTTQGKQSFKYGRVDIRAALPYGQGIWPALWMLGDKFSTDGWPHCGEIDIMEMVGGTSAGKGDNKIHGTAHWNGNNGYASSGQQITLSSGIFAEEFHVFSIIWDSNSIKWYRDDILYFTLNITANDMSEFHEKFFFIFNIAVGGDWPGSPDSSTKFPQKMYIDYIRVFQ